MIRPRRLCTLLRCSAAARKTKRTSTAPDEASAPSVTLANSKAPDRCPAPDERAAYVCCVLRVRCCICPAAAGYRLVPSTGSAGAWQLMRCRAECVPRRRRHMPPLRRSPRVRFGSQARGAAAPSKLSAVQTAYGQRSGEICAAEQRQMRSGRACSESTSPMRAPGRFGVRRAQCLAAARRAPVPHAAARRQHPSRPALSQAELARTQHAQARRRA